MEEVEKITFSFKCNVADAVNSESYSGADTLFGGVVTFH